MEPLAKLHQIVNPNTNCQLADIPVTEVTVKDKNSLIISGNEIDITSEAYTELLGISGVGTAIRELGRSTTEEAGRVVLNQVLKGKGRDQKITFLFDGKKISRISTPEKGKVAIAPERFVNHIEHLLEKKSDKISIDSIHLSDDLSKVSVRVSDPTPKGIVHLPGEDYYLGRSLEWDRFGGTSLFEHILREVCGNGMRGERADYRGQLTSLSDGEAWYNALFNETTAQRIIERYETAVTGIQDTVMSAREYDIVMKTASNYTEDFGKIGEQFGDTAWIGEWMKHGYNLEEMKAEELRNVWTPFKLWDGINMLTWLASHPQERKTNVSSWDDHRIQKKAGTLLFGSHDGDAFIKSGPSFN